MIGRAYSLASTLLVAFFILAMTGAYVSQASAHSGHHHPAIAKDSIQRSDAARNPHRLPETGSLLNAGRASVYVEDLSSIESCQGLRCPAGSVHLCAGGCCCSSVCQGGTALLSPALGSTAPTAFDKSGAWPVEIDRPLSVVFRLDRPPKV